MTDHQRKVLTRARELLTVGWTQRKLARNASGLSRDYWSEDAVAFCVMGAFYRAESDLADYTISYDGPYYDLLGFTFSSEVEDWNDSRDTTQAEVLARIDNALAEDMKTTCDYLGL